MINTLKRLTPIDYLFIFCFIYVGAALNSRINKFDGWAIGDWLIHYQDGGYKRRGLAGTFLVFLSQYLPVKLVLLSFLGGIYAGFLLILRRLIHVQKDHFNLHFLLFLPWVLSYMFFDKAVVGRKEVLLFLYYLLLCWKLPLKKGPNHWIILTLYLVLILIHELAFFFFPYIGLLVYITTEDKKKAYQYITYLLIGSTGLVFSLLYFGHDINCGKSIENLTRIGYPIKCLGNVNDCSIFSWVQEKSFLKRFQNGIIGVSEYIIAYAVYILILSKFIIKPFRLKFLVLIFGFTLFSFPLFYLGIDWGRWINIHLMLSVFLFIKYPQLIRKEKLAYPYYLLAYLLGVLLLVGHSSDGFLLFL